MIDFSKDKDFNSELHDTCECLLSYYHSYNVNDDINFKRNNIIFDLYRLIYDKIMDQAFGSGRANEEMVNSWMEKLNEKCSMKITTAE